MNVLILNDGTKLEYTLGGAVSMIGDMYIDVPNITLTKAVSLFSDAEKTRHMEFSSGEHVMAFDNFTVLGGVEIPYNLPDTVRITMRKSTNSSEEALADALAEAEQYRLALEELGINTEEVVS